MENAKFITGSSYTEVKNKATALATTKGWKIIKLIQTTTTKGCLTYKICYQQRNNHKKNMIGN